MSSPQQSNSPAHLSRRERQLMDVVYAAGSITAADLRAALPDPPSYSAVRALLRILETKGHLKHTESAGRYVYTPTRPRAAAGRSALRRVLGTFFDNSASRAVAALLDAEASKLSEQELDELSAMIERARKARKP